MKLLEAMLVLVLLVLSLLFSGGYAKGVHITDGA
jgi:hypothetical protein